MPAIDRQTFPHGIFVNKLSNPPYELAIYYDITMSLTDSYCDCLIKPILFSMQLKDFCKDLTNQVEIGAAASLICSVIKNDTIIEAVIWPKRCSIFD